MIQVREMNRSDLSAVVELAAELGYPASRKEVAQRFSAIADDRDHGLFVAEADGAVVGWVHVHGSRLLMAPPRSELGGLVVRGRSRGRGAGRALMQRAEAWTLDHGYGGLRVRSNIVRGEARRFYEAIGYATVKTSHVFEKHLSAD